jgi:hypothetical protein
LQVKVHTLNISYRMYFCNCNLVFVLVFYWTRKRTAYHFINR